MQASYMCKYWQARKTVQNQGKLCEYHMLLQIFKNRVNESRRGTFLSIKPIKQMHPSNIFVKAD